jgi:hypothetical protein
VARFRKPLQRDSVSAARINFNFTARRLLNAGFYAPKSNHRMSAGVQG